MKTVVITGGCGFIGSNTSKSFLDKGFKVVVLDNLYRAGASSNLEWLQSQAGDDAFHFFNVDIASQTEVFDIFNKFKNIEGVFHLAGQVAATTSIANPVRDFATNAQGTFNLCEAVRRYSPKALLVFSSTNKVYGDLARYKIEEAETRYVVPEHPRGFPEDTLLDFYSPYGCSKGSGDQYVRDYHRIFGLNSAVLRLSTIYGGRQFATYDQGWIGWFTEQFLKNNPFTVSGTGKQVRDLLHIEDLVSLFHTMLERKETVAGEIFNIGGGIDNSFSLLELFDFLKSELGAYPEKTHIDKRKGDQDFYVSKLDKVTELTGWSPKVSKEEGVRKIIQWIKEIV